LSVYRIAANHLRTPCLLHVKSESPTVKIFTFNDKQCAKAKPGQFLMLWIPGVDEIPLSIFDANGKNTVSVVTKEVGEATRALNNRRAGDTVGVRGPFGSNFTLGRGRILLVGGGTGIAPLLLLAKQLASKAKKLVFVIGAKKRDELLFLEELEEKYSRNLIVTTEDGSYGIKCLATTTLEPLLANESFDMIYTCGPEQMMRKVFDLAEKHGIALEASLERLIRCSIGLCGSCVIGKYRVCRDGPVFTGGQLREVKNEFGNVKRGFNGRKIPLE